MFKKNLALLTLLTSLSAQAATITIDFEDMSKDVLVDNFYLSQGVVFKKAKTANHRYGDGYISLIHSETGVRPQPANPIIAVFTSAVSSVSLEGRDVNFSGYLLRAYDSEENGTLLGEKTKTKPGNTSHNDNFILSIEAEGIKRIEFSQMVYRIGDGVWFDNLTFTAKNTPLVFSNTYISAGASAQVDGDIVANTYLVSGADTAVKGDIQVGAAVTTGATTTVTGYIKAGTAITLGATTVVDGDLCYGTALTQGAGASFYYDDCSMEPMTYTRDDVIAAQDSFNALTPVYVEDRNQLSPTMPGDLTLNADDGSTTIIAATTVVYNATSLTTAAGVTLTLEGDYDWVFNITNMLSLGAGTKIVLAEDSKGSVTWNVGGYASIGSDAEIAGVILADGYISTGVRAKVNGAGRSSATVEPSQSYCGGLFSANSYITIGASSTVTCE